MAREGPGEEGQRGGWQEPSTPCLESGSDFVLRTVGATAGLKKGMTRSYLCFTATSWLSTEEQRAAGGGEATKGLGHQCNGVWGGQLWGLDLGVVVELATRGARRGLGSQSPGGRWSGCELCLLPLPNS